VGVGDKEGRGGMGGEMTQTLYAQMNKRKKKNSDENKKGNSLRCIIAKYYKS
jgi:hypothetical protein